MTQEELKNIYGDVRFSSHVPHAARRPLPQLKLLGDFEQMFSHWEAMFLCSIINSTQVINGRVRKIYWRTREEMIAQFGSTLLDELKTRKAIEEWTHFEDFQAITLTPWCASVAGVRLAEYWVRHIDRVKEYRGVGRKLARIRVQRWDTESYWTYSNKPDKPLRIPGNTCELPLIGDPEDKRSVNNGPEYLEDWQTFTFTRNPNKAMSITIRVGSFAHKIIIQRDRIKSRLKTKKKRSETWINIKRLSV